jgi:hypothetical protein
VRSTVLAGVGGTAGAPVARKLAPTAAPAAGSSGRALSLLAALGAGLVLALLLLSQFEPWLHYHRVFIGH